MKQLITLMVLTILSGSVTLGQGKKAQPAQQPTQPAVKEEPKKESVSNSLLEHYVRKRAVAARWNDYEIVRDAMYDMIIEDPANDSLIAQLAYLYFDNQKFPSTVLVCQDLLNRNPKNVQALEMAAISYENLSLLDRALQSYESLFLLTGNITSLYKMAFLQFELKRYAESITNADIMLGKPDVDTMKVQFNDKDGKPKEYPVRIALLNLKGMVYKDQADKVNAKKFFEEALKLAPDFAPAKQGLDSLK
jgi:tetratricopeptide (TPR) repeat protein